MDFPIDDFPGHLDEVIFKAADAYGDDELVAMLARADFVFVATVDDDEIEDMPGVIHAEARRALTCARGDNGVLHSPRERRLAALQLLAEAQDYYAAPAAVALAGPFDAWGHRAAFIVVPLYRIEPVAGRHH